MKFYEAIFWLLHFSLQSDCFSLWNRPATYQTCSKSRRIHTLSSSTATLQSDAENNVMKIGLLLHPFGRYADLLEDAVRIFHGTWTSDERFINKTSLSIIPLPNIYELNDKRFEKRWLDYMQAELLHPIANEEHGMFKSQVDQNKFDILVASDTASSEALLRFSETNAVRYVMLTDPFDLYTSGERHGRDFRVSRMHENAIAVSFLITNSTYIKPYLKFRKSLEGKIVRTYTVPSVTDHIRELSDGSSVTSLAISTVNASSSLESTRNSSLLLADMLVQSLSDTILHDMPRA